MRLNRLVENHEVFSSVSAKMSKWSSMLHIMVLLKYYGSYGNEASLQKIGQMMDSSKGGVNKYDMHVVPIQNFVIKLLNGQMNQK